MPEMQDEGMSKIELFWINFESWIWGFPLDQLQVSDCGGASIRWRFPEKLSNWNTRDSYHGHYSLTLTADAERSILEASSSFITLTY